MKKYDDDICKMFRLSREASGKSQDYVAKKLGVSRKSIQNWESGVTTPTLSMTFEWFDAIGVPMYPYFMSILHPIEIEGISYNTDEGKLRKALDVYVKEMPDNMIAESLFLFFGKHGSSPEGVLEMITAYLHLPLPMKIAIAQNIYVTYEMCEVTNILGNPNDVKPNAETIRICADIAKDAVVNGKDSYL